MIGSDAKFKFNTSGFDYAANVKGLLLSIGRKGMDELVEYLTESDFFTAPASAKYHSSYQGGLAEHSYKVYELFYRKCISYKVSYDIDSIIIASLLHDLCKVNFYKIEEKWRKDDRGKWESYKAYGYDDLLPLGHGEKSALIAQKFIELTDSELLMIRWHMAFSANCDQIALHNAIQKEPLIVLLHTSDFESSFIFENR